MSKRTALIILATGILSPTVYAQSYCTVGAEQWVSGCYASCTASWNGGSSCNNSCTATPPAGYVLIDHRISVKSQNNGGHDVSRMSAGQTFDYKRKVEDAYKYALEVAGKANNKSAEGKIHEDMQSALAEAESFSSSHQMVRLAVHATRQGHKYIDQRRGWSRVEVQLLVRCVVPPNLEQQLMAKYALQ